MHITLLKSNLNKPNGCFLIWSSEKSFRHFFWHGFKGVNSNRYHFTFHFMGFVAAGAF